MEIKKQLIKEIDRMIARNSLPRNGDFEIVACGDISSVKVFFAIRGGGATQKKSIFRKRFDKFFDIEEFVDKVLTLL